MSGLDDLSGVELRRRLEQRDVDPRDIDHFLDHRDDCQVCRKFLVEFLRL